MTFSCFFSIYMEKKSTFPSSIFFPSIRLHFLHVIWLTCNVMHIFSVYNKSPSNHQPPFLPHNATHWLHNSMLLYCTISHSILYLQHKRWRNTETVYLGPLGGGGPLGDWAKIVKNCEWGPQRLYLHRNLQKSPEHLHILFTMVIYGFARTVELLWFIIVRQIAIEYTINSNRVYNTFLFNMIIW